MHQKRSIFHDHSGISGRSPAYFRKSRGPQEKRLGALVDGCRHFFLSWPALLALVSLLQLAFREQHRLVSIQVGTGGIRDLRPHGALIQLGKAIKRWSIVLSGFLETTTMLADMFPERT